MSLSSQLAAAIVAKPKDAAATATRRYEIQRAQVYAATWASYAGFYFTRKVFGIVKAPMKQTLAVDDLALSWIWTAYLVAYMLGMFGTAGLGRRFSNRQLLLFGMGGSIAANLLVGALLGVGAGAYWLIMVVMFAHGLAQSTGWPANVGIMANWTRQDNRGTVMGIWGTCYQLGSVFAKGFAAFVFAWLGLQWSYWGTSLILAGVWLLFLLWAREHPENEQVQDTSVPENQRDQEVDADQEKVSQGLPQPATPVYSVMRMAAFMGAIYFAFKFLRYALDSWSALLINETFQWSTEASGYLSAVFDWVGFAGVIVAGIASDHLCKGARGPVIFVMTLGLMLAIALLCVFGLSSPLWFGIALGLVGFMLMGPDALISGTAAMEVGTKKQVMMVTAVINGMGSLGPIVQEPLIGWLKTRHGAIGVMATLASMAVLAVIGTFGFWRMTRRPGRLPAC